MPVKPAKKKPVKSVSKPDVKTAKKKPVKSVAVPKKPAKRTTVEARELADIERKSAKTASKPVTDTAIKTKKGPLTVREHNEVEILISRMPDELKDDSHVGEYVHIFRQLQDMSRALEKKCSSGDTRAIYAQMKVYDQMREAIADIRALRDNNASVEDCVDRIVNPMVEAALQAIVAFRQEVRHSATQHLKNGDVLQRFLSQIDDCARRAGSSLKEASDAAHQNIVRIFK